MIDYCKQILGKSIRDLTIEDLKEYFSESKEETEILEFKSGHGDFEKIFNNNILRTICAFLNSSGGVLIWGAPADKAPEKGLPKVCIGALFPVNEKKEKDQLINRIATSISYMPIGIKVERLESDNGFVYIIEVQESESKPHQLNGQYLIRLDGQSKPAPHYIVDSMFNQIKHADVDLEIKLNKIVKINNKTEVDIEVIIFNFTRLVVAKNLLMHFYTHQGNFLSSSTCDEEVRTPSIHYGLNPRAYLKIILREYELINNNSLIKIEISFASDNSPSKISSYTLNLSPYFTTGNLIQSEAISYDVKNKKMSEIIDENEWFNKEEYKNYITK
ncbi:ATP-binding protein [Sphingobacterium faecium]|uniref:AlbA family DNA-binding domain-containing protein n=1 Tax=Sphingobacterium faecium TaxID=34087 RepID=UPI0021B4D97A|nr:ATP-binding protein [Sphingobacterium faecium]UXD67761.1 ATP-binding protein [Sphingobacterium faecium]